MLLGEGQGNGRKTLLATLAERIAFFLDIVLIIEISFQLRQFRIESIIWKSDTQNLKGVQSYFGHSFAERCSSSL